MLSEPSPYAHYRACALDSDVTASVPPLARRQSHRVVSLAVASAVAAVTVLAVPDTAHAAAPLDSPVIADVAQAASAVDTTVGDPCNAGNLPVACGTPTTISYGNGTGKRLVSFAAGGNTYQVLPVDADESYAEVYRVDNPRVTGERDNIFLARATEDTPFNQVLNEDAGDRTMAEVFTSDVITEGSDNTFANGGGTNFNNVERISFLRRTPLTSSSPDRIGLTLLERGANDIVKVASVLSVDAGGNPASWGPIVTVPTSAWGTVLANVPSTVFRRDAADTQYRPTDRTGTQTLGGMYISFAELGVAAGMPVFGVSLLPADTIGTDVATAPINLDSTDAGNNGLDLIGGVFVSAIPPVAADDSSSGPQGAPQALDILATPGDALFPIDATRTELLAPAGGTANADGSVVTVPNVGTYTLNRATSTVVFQPTPSFVGAAPVVTYRIYDSQGATDEATLSPTVTPVAVADTSTGPQGVAQTVDVVANDTASGVTLDRSTLTLLDASGAAATSVTIPNQGTYTVNATNDVVFTPLPAFVGTATPVRYQVDDTNGNTVESTYTPTVTAVAPTANPDTTTGPRGAQQSIDALANDTAGSSGVPLDPASLTLLDSAGNPATTVSVTGGVFSVSSGRLVFTPDADFVGTAPPVGYRVADVNGATTSSTYTPTVVDATPAQVGAVVETGEPGSAVTLDPSDVSPGIVPGSVTLVGPGGSPVTRLVVPGQGVWSVATDTGLVTFTPQSGYRGQPSVVTFTGVTADGTPVTGTLQVRYRQLAATGASGVDRSVGFGAALLVGGFLLMLSRRRRRGPVA